MNKNDKGTSVVPQTKSGQGTKEAVQWAIFLTIHHMLQTISAPFPEPWGLGGHCALTAAAGAALTELVTGLPCWPVCGACLEFLRDGRCVGYRPEDVDWNRGYFHSFFLVDGAPVDLRLYLYQEEVRPYLVRHPADFPFFAWGELPSWLWLQPQPGPTRLIQYSYVDLKHTPSLYNSFILAAHLLREGFIAQAGTLLGVSFKQFMRQQRQQRQQMRQEKQMSNLEADRG